MAIDITREEFMRRFGYDPLGGSPPIQGGEAPPDFPPPGGIEGNPEPVPFAPEMPEGTPSIQAPHVAPPEGTQGFPTPGVQPDPFSQPEDPMAAADPRLMRKLVQGSFLGPLRALVAVKPEILGEHGAHLAQALAAGAETFQGAYLDMLSDPSFKRQMVVLAEEMSDRSLPEDFGQPVKDPMPDEQVKEAVLASKDPERLAALRIGGAAATDLARMADLIDESVGKADGLNEKFRVDMVSLFGVAKDKILDPLTESGDLDGATRFDEMLSALEGDILDLAGQGYHPNAIPLRVALQYRFEVDKHPDLMEDSGFGKALRQMRGLLKSHIEDKVARSARLTSAVSPAEWRTSMNAHEQAFEIAKLSEPSHYRSRKR